MNFLDGLHTPVYKSALRGIRPMITYSPNETKELDSDEFKFKCLDGINEFDYSKKRW